VLRILGIGTLVAGGLAIALAALIAAILVGPLIFWIAWNVLNFGSAVGLPELGFWGIVLATLFLVVSWFGKVLITAIVFLVDPSWFHGAAEVRWPEPTFRNFVAVALLALLTSRPHAHAHEPPPQQTRPFLLAGEPAVAVSRRLGLRQASVSLLLVGRFYLDARTVPERSLVHRVGAPVLGPLQGAVGGADGLMLSRSDREDGARSARARPREPSSDHKNTRRMIVLGEG